jgi:hypothetical protein
MKMKKATIKKELPSLALGIGGGFAANQITNFLEKQPFMANYVKYAPLATLAAGIAGVVLSKNPTIKEICKGIVIVSGTEQMESSVSGLMSGLDEDLGLGFIPVNRTAEDQPVYVAGLPIR